MVKPRRLPRPYLTMKRFIRGTTFFVCLWVTCVTLFLLLGVNQTSRNDIFPLPSNRASSLFQNVPSFWLNRTEKHLVVKNAVNVQNTTHSNSKHTNNKPNPHHWSMWKHGVNLNIEHNSTKVSGFVRIVKKGYNLSAGEPLDHIEYVLGKLPNINDTTSVIYMRRQAEENRYYSLGTTKINCVESEFIITGGQICDAKSPFLLIIVPSIPTHSSVRDVIRKTYGSYAKGNGIVHRKSNVTLDVSVKLVFLVGRDGNMSTDVLLKNESRAFGDIVQANFQESYYNLTRKMLIALKWTAFYCNEIDYVLKIDEDVFVNIPILVRTLKKMPYGMKGTIYGHINQQSTVRRTGKWKVGWKEFPLRFYPNYASGNSYVISGNIIPRMFMVSEYFPYMPIEDAFITGILGRVVEAKLVDVRGFTFWADSEPKPCAFVRESRISCTKVTEILMEKLWQAVTEFDKYCRYNINSLAKHFRKV